LKRVVNHNKTYYEHISKYGKSIGKELISKPEYEDAFFPDFALNNDILNQTIAEHMYRSGNFTAGEAFSLEANLSLSDSFKSRFLELNHIVRDLKLRQITSALTWAKTNEEALDQMGSDLLFQLH
jgi:hypothetical protein